MVKSSIPFCEWYELWHISLKDRMLGYVEWLMEETSGISIIVGGVLWIIWSNVLCVQSQKDFVWGRKANYKMG